MTAQIIDGKAIARQIRQEVAQAVTQRAAQGLRPPGLAVILVGDNPASRSYVRGKARACDEAGLHSRQIDFPAEIEERELLTLVEQLNGDPQVDGILVQLPLPDHIDENRVIETIEPNKDVDGFHPINAGNLMIGRQGFVPCTPLGIRELLVRSNIETKGKFAVVVGRSNIVGKPVAQLLLQKAPGGNATVCVAHSATPNLKAITRQADILVAAMGHPHAITADLIKPGAAVIDVGINRVEDPSRERGYRLVGDVDYAPACEVAGWITPVPGGVGPMTIAMLLRNTLESAARRDAAGAASA